MATLLARPPVCGPRPPAVDEMRGGGRAAAAAQEGMARRSVHTAAGVLARDTGEAAEDGLGACAPAGALRKPARPSLAPSRPRRDQRQCKSLSRLAAWLLQL
eukprot:scaffold37132_cov57-Phaeocystis_antarctica.AAC.5